jgi:acetyltransferase-like isoleucine patch superfamily enzyme
MVMSDLVAHDVQIGDFTSLSFGSTVLGHVQIGQDVFVGSGAIINNGSLDRPLTIGDGAVIGAGAVVTHDVAPGQVMVGPRAMPLDEWKSLLGSRAGSGPRVN